jgi:hypothetical protein
MVVPEFGAIVVEAPLIEQVSCAGVVHACIVQHDEARIAHQIGPQVVVTRRIAELVDDKIVRGALLAPEEVVRVEQRRPTAGHAWAIDIAVDGMFAGQRRDRVGAVGGYARTSRGQGRKPGNTHVAASRRLACRQYRLCGSGGDR